MILVMSVGVKLPVSVPYVSTKSERGFATPIAYESCTSARLQSPLFTTDLAICRQAYAAERSTLVGSLPEKAPPPCAPQPPYVSMMIFRPVRPASPWGPPMMNFPDGLMCKFVCDPYKVTAGLPFFNVISSRHFTITSLTMSSFIRAMLGAVSSAPVQPSTSLLLFATPGSACWVEMTTVWIDRGSTEPSAFWRYSIVTCVLPSGRSHQRWPLLRTSVSFLPKRVAKRWVRGMQTSVSSDA